MAEISSINGAGAAASITTTRMARPEPGVAESPAADQVEISELARLLSALDPADQARVRAQKVADIREAIANGTYETADKIDYVAYRLMDVLHVPSDEVPA